MTYTGHCSCGAVSARIEGEPLRVSQCWCRQCQRIAGGGCTTNALFPAEAVAFEGEPTYLAYPGDSGSEVKLGFCEKCGTHMFGYSTAHPNFWAFRLGFFDQPHGLRPAFAIWTEAAPDWAVIDPDIPHLARQSGFPIPE